MRRAGEYRLTPWKNGGGTTAEIARSPGSATLENFDWRISMATIAVDGPFSRFDGIDRGLLVLEGELHLLTGRSPAVVLTPETMPLGFPGEQPIVAHIAPGPVLDLNVMTRRGRFAQRIARRRLAGKVELVTEMETTILLSRASRIAVSAGDRAFLLGLNDTLIVPGSRVPLALESPTPATAIVIGIDRSAAGAQ